MSHTFNTADMKIICGLKRKLSSLFISSPLYSIANAQLVRNWTECATQHCLEVNATISSSFSKTDLQQASRLWV